MSSLEEIKKNSPFPIGEENKAFEQFFTGKSYIAGLTNEQMPIANVTFEPGCRNNWHIHQGAGQILLCLAGKGFYQEWANSRRRFMPEML